MKNLIKILFAGAVLISCNNQSNPTTDLGKLMAERDQLKASKDSIGLLLAELETQISALDTTKKLSLVTLKESEQKRFEHFFKVYGTVQTDNMAMINAETQGKIESIWIEEGTKVSKGQKLAQINADVIRRSIAELENRLELAQTVFERQERLWNQNIGSEIQYLQAKNDRDAIKKSLQTAQEQLAITTITAPFNGVIDEVFPKEGEYTAPGAPFFRLVNLEKVYIKADISENYLGKIKEGDSVIVEVPNVKDATFQTSISRIGDFINPDNRTFKIKLELKNTSNILKPNMLAEISIRDYQNDSAVVIPENLILQGAQNEYFVYTLNTTSENTGVAQKAQLEIGKSYNNEVEILKGLPANTMVIDKGARSIQNGEVVEITTTQEL